MTKWLIAFDIDGTLTKERSSWQFIHRQLGTTNQASLNLQLYKSGKITYRRWGVVDALLWKGVPAKRIEAVVKKIPLTDGAKEAIKALKNEDFVVGAISSCISHLACRVSRELGLDFVESNLLHENDGVITGETDMSVSETNKHQILKNIVKRLRSDLNQSVAVGDNWVDAKMLEIAGFGIAFNPNDEAIINAANIVVKSNFKKVAETAIAWKNNES